MDHFFFHSGPTDGFGHLGTSCFEDSVCPLLFDIIKNCCALLYVTVYHLPDPSQDPFRGDNTIFRSGYPCLSVCLLVPRLLLFISSFDSIFQHRSSASNSTTLASLLIPFVLGPGTLHSFRNSNHSTPFPLRSHRMPWRIMLLRQPFICPLLVAYTQPTSDSCQPPFLQRHSFPFTFLSHDTVLDSSPHTSLTSMRDLRFDSVGWRDALVSIIVLDLLVYVFRSGRYSSIYLYKKKQRRLRDST